MLHNILDVTSGHALGIESENLLIKAWHAALMLFDNLRLKCAVAIAWCLDRNLADITLDRFWLRPLRRLDGSLLPGPGHC